MKRIHSIITVITLATLALLSACTDRFPIGDLANNSNRLVVEGRFTNENQPHTIYLSRTLAYTTPTPNGQGYPLESGATVTITDDQGKTISFSEVSPGVYTTTTNAKGEIGRIYTLNITTNDGKKYSSEPEKMTEVPPINGVNVLYENRANPFENTTERVAIINIKFEDLPNSNDYYMWYWKTGPSSQFSIVDSSWAWSYSADRYVVGADQGFDLTELTGDDIEGFVKVYQTSISQKAYDFFQVLTNQENNSLGPFSTPPAPIRGNITNTTNDKDFALGFFTVSSVHSITVKLE